MGNRLLDESQRTVQATLERANAITSGHRACQGCGEALGARYVVDTAMSACDNQLVAANATGCLEVFTTPYPESAWQLPWLHSLFGNTAAVASGIAAALKAKGRSDVRVLAQGGDGGTTDIETQRTAGIMREIMEKGIATSRRARRRAGKRQARQLLMRAPWLLSRKVYPLPGPEELPPDAAALRLALTGPKAAPSSTAATPTERESSCAC